MFKKFFSLFSLEDRISNQVNHNFTLSQQSLQRQLDTFEKSVRATTQQFDKLKTDLNYRLSRIEQMFAQELEEKESARDQAIKDRRLNG